MATLITGGKIIDPGNFTGFADIYIEKSKIVKIFTPDLNTDLNKDEYAKIKKSAKIIDASGKIICPGLIDMHVHLRDPGELHKETIKSGSQAAAAGGFTTICAMPNTNPVNDNEKICEYIFKTAQNLNLINIYPVAAITYGLKGETLTDFKKLKKAGAIAFSDDGCPVLNSKIMRKALETSKKLNSIIISHCEDTSLSQPGVINEGKISTKTGYPGISNASESIMVLRDIELSKLTNSWVHIAHVSTKESVSAIRNAKKNGVKITAETAPHYFTLTEDDVLEYGTSAKMNPPLRSNEDKEAIIEALIDDTIDVIATDHAPHAEFEKNVDFIKAPFGTIGLETSLPISLKLVKDDHISIEKLIQKMSKNPAKILGINNDIKINNPANITIIDLDQKQTINKDNFLSLSKNSCFDKFQTAGIAILTMVKGKVIFEK